MSSYKIIIKTREYEHAGVIFDFINNFVNEKEIDGRVGGILEMMYVISEDASGNIFDNSIVIGRNINISDVNIFENEIGEGMITFNVQHFGNALNILRFFHLIRIDRATGYLFVMYHEEYGKYESSSCQMGVGYDADIFEVKCKAMDGQGK